MVKCEKCVKSLLLNNTYIIILLGIAKNVITLMGIVKFTITYPTQSARVQCKLRGTLALA